MIKSNLRWPGGKSRMLGEISSYFPEKFDKYFELFCGGGSVGIYVLQHYSLSYTLFNDIDDELICYYETITDEFTRQSFINNLLNIKNFYTSDSFSDVFLRMNKENIFDTPTRFFLTNKTSFGGLKFSTYSKQAWNQNFTNNSIHKCAEIGKLFYSNNVDYENNSFEKSSLIDREGFFVYADPPYFSNSKKGLYGKKGELHKNFDHKTFVSYIRKVGKKNMFMISYDDVPEVREWFVDYRVISFQKKYSMTNSGGNICKNGKELLVLNY